MTAKEKGYLMLCSRLGNCRRPVLTGPQLRVLTQRVRMADRQASNRSLRDSDLVALGYSPQQAIRILSLLNDELLLAEYVKLAKKAGCVPLTRVSAQYPRLLNSRLGADSPGCLWAKGDLSLLEKPAVAVVGSREPTAAARDFAIAAGRMAARQGFVLVSGNAKGVDSFAQNACLDEGGSVISVVADSLKDKADRKGLLYISEDCFDFGFTPARALSRNRVIHCLGQKTLVSQCRLGRGGTWNGSVNNLKNRWSPVFCFDDGTATVRELQNRGAKPITMEDLKDLNALEPEQQTLFEA